MFLLKYIEIVKYPIDKVKIEKKICSHTTKPLNYI